MAKSLNVSIYDPETGSFDPATCLELEGDISKQTLAEIRSDLVKQKVLDSAQAKFPFCNKSGAKVPDRTTFANYEGWLSPDKEEESASATENKILYLRANPERKIANEVSPEVKEHLAKLDLSHGENRAQLLEAQAKLLTSSFNPASYMAKAVGNGSNPAALSEKDWDVVIRNNSVLNAHRLTFTRRQDGHAIFRRIERASFTGLSPLCALILSPQLLRKPTAFKLLHRKFQSFEATVDGIEVDHEFRIPRFVVEDDAYVDSFETKTSVSSSFARSSFAQTEIEASVSGGAFGVSAGISAGFSKNESNGLSEAESEEKKMMHISYNFPRVVLHLDQYSLGLSTECSEDLERLRSLYKSNPPTRKGHGPVVDELIAFHHKYGHFFATRVELGGRLYSSESFAALATASTSEATRQMKMAANASISSSFVQASASYSKSQQSAQQNSQSNSSMQSSISWSAKGGNTLLCNNPPEWCPTVGDFQNWRVVKQEDVLPLNRMIGKIPKFDWVPALFDDIAEKQTVSFRLKATTWNLHGVQGYVSLYPDSQKLEGEVREFAGSKTSYGLERDFCLWTVSSGKDTTFDIEVNSVLGRLASIEYYTAYKIKNRRHHKWLRAYDVSVNGKKYTTLIDADEEKATFFKFEPLEKPSKEDGATIENGDAVRLMILGEDNIARGYLGLRFKGETLGAIHGSEDALQPSVCRLRWERVPEDKVPPSIY
ncbi:hypothetical protein BJX61DRAFT_543675 [Aspergillus egyptiacus]|nr:hypothetical protein BJX61DRAFT_543675 [Aspergillus egyptiacus]